MPPSLQPVRFKSALRVQFTSILEGGRRTRPANYSSRNDDGKYFAEIEVLVCLEMIWRGLDAEFKSRDFLMISSPPINWCVHNFLNILHPLSLVDFGWQLTFRKRILRCRVSSDHCVWSELFKHALKLLIGRWWEGELRETQSSFPFCETKRFLWKYQ